MLNKVKKHLKTFASNNKIPCSHSRCKAAKLILPNVITFKNYIAKVHKIVLRKQTLLALSIFCLLYLVLLILHVLLVY